MSRSALLGVIEYYGPDRGKLLEEKADEAVTWLERAISERTRFVTHIRVDPILRPLLGERRFSQLVRQVIGQQKPELREA